MWAPPCLPQDRGKDSELELETGDALMLRSRQVKRLLDGELAELRAQLVDQAAQSNGPGLSASGPGSEGQPEH